jgi:hypothetical protein
MACRDAASRDPRSGGGSGTPSPKLTCLPFLGLRSPAVQDVVAGHIGWHMGTVSSSLAPERGGRILVLAVTHSAPPCPTPRPSRNPVIPASS